MSSKMLLLSAATPLGLRRHLRLSQSASHECQGEERVPHLDRLSVRCL